MVSGQKKPTRCNTLKGGYTEQAIRERIAGTYISSVQPKRSHSSVRMLIDIDAAMRSGKGAGYERWAKVFNVKQLAKAVAYLKEHGDMSYEDLQAKSQATTFRFNEAFHADQGYGEPFVSKWRITKTDRQLL